MAHQLSFTDPQNGINYPTAYGKLDRFNDTDLRVTESIRGFYEIYQNQSAKEAGNKPLKSIYIIIGDGFCYLDRENPIMDGETIVGYPTVCEERTDQNGQTYLLWDNVFDGVSINYSTREQKESALFAAIYNYVNTLENLDGVNMTGAINV